jgi:pSer/pThr/pTyr-binding forkhead associated (FHA) protein
VQATVGRLTDNTVSIEDSEVSSTHCLLTWDFTKRAWQVMDLGSLNGTRLNGNFISNTIRRAGKYCRLRTDDILLLGSRTAIKVPFLKYLWGGGRGGLWVGGCQSSVV